MRAVVVKVRIVRRDLRGVRARRDMCYVVEWADGLLGVYVAIAMSAIECVVLRGVLACKWGLRSRGGLDFDEDPWTPMASTFIGMERWLRVIIELCCVYDESLNLNLHLSSSSGYMQISKPSSASLCEVSTTSPWASPAQALPLLHSSSGSCP